MTIQHAESGDLSGSPLADACPAPSSAGAAGLPLRRVRAVASAAATAANLATGVASRLVWRSTHWLWRLLPGTGKGVALENRRDEGPPDLDELWRDFNRKLSGLFSGRSGGDSNNGPGGSMSPDPTGAGIGVGLVAGLVVLVWAGSGIFIVQEGQQGVIMSFGSYSRTVDAGLQWRAPYPFQSHEIVNVAQLRSIDVGNASVTQSTGLRDSSMLTRDENIIDIQFTVQYRLDDVRKYLFENRNADEAVLQASESAVREVVGNSTMDSVLYEKRDAIPAELTKSIQAQLKKVNAGVSVVNVNIRSVQAPEQVQAAFDDAIKAGADRERLKNEGQAYANDVIPRAQGTAARLREEASAYAARVVAQADGDAQRFKSVLAEYQKAPGVTRDRLYIDTMQQVYSNVTKVMVDSRQGSNLLYLPLDKLMQAGAPASAPAAQAQGSAQSDASGSSAPASSLPGSLGMPGSDPRSREGLRGREREVR